MSHFDEIPDSKTIAALFLRCKKHEFINGVSRSSYPLNAFFSASRANDCLRRLLDDW